MYLGTDKIRKYIKTSKSGNPRKDRGKTQRIYLLRIHDLDENNNHEKVWNGVYEK
jgi:hypothetical protein